MIPVPVSLIVDWIEIVPPVRPMTLSEWPALLVSVPE